MKNVIPFTKEIIFDNKISEITSISLEENYNCTCDTIDGEFVISGDYTTHELSVNKEPFEYKLPFSVDLTEKIIPDSLNFEIVDFSYDILNENTLKVNIEFQIDADLEQIRENSIEEIENYLDEEIEKEKVENLVAEQSIENNENDDDANRIDLDDENTILDSINQEDNEFTTYHVHIVKESETIESICAMYHSNSNLLAEYNDLNEFKVGEKLIVVEEDE